MKGLIVSLVVLLAMAAGADFIARGVAEERIAERVQRSLELDARPKVDIGGWPFLLSAFNGTIPRLEIASTDVSRRGITLNQVTLHLVDLRFDVSELIREDGRVRISGGDGKATMSDDELTDLLQRRGAPVAVRFVDDRTLVSASGVGEVAGNVSLDGGDLVVSADRLPRSYSISLPRLGRRIEYRSLAIADDRARLTLDLLPGMLEL
jgi:hypothetical protein